jgi:RNA polymerase sigma factor (sigma-70 family)
MVVTFLPQSQLRVMNTMTLEADVALAMRGDADAYQRLVAQCANTVCSIALAIVRNVAASEDVAQEVFLAAWMGMRKLRNPSSFLPWLRQVTRNQANLYLRAHLRELGNDEALAAAIDARPTPVDALLVEEERRVLAEVLDALPDDAREVVILYYRESSSARHVAQLLGISEDAVKQRLSRARAKIRGEMLRRFGGTLVRTAPGAAFAMAVASSVVAPSATAAVTTTSVKAVFGFAILKTAFAGALAAVAGVLIGMKQLEPFFDADEERALKRLRTHALITVVLGSILAAVSWKLEAPPRWRSLAPLLVFLAAIAYLYYVRLPRILERRFAWEREIDSIVAQQHRREWMRETAGRAAAVVCAGLAFMFALVRLF